MLIIQKWLKSNIPQISISIEKWKFLPFWQVVVLELIFRHAPEVAWLEFWAFGESGALHIFGFVHLIVVCCGNVVKVEGFDVLVGFKQEGRGQVVRLVGTLGRGRVEVGVLAGEKAVFPGFMVLDLLFLEFIFYFWSFVGARRSWFGFELRVLACWKRRWVLKC